MKRFLVWVLSTVGFLSLSVLFVASIAFYRFQKNEIDPEKLTDTTVLTLKVGSKFLSEFKSENKFLSHLFGETRPYLQDVIRSIQEASKDNRVRGILLELTGSAISASQAQELRNALKLFRVNGKFVYAFSVSLGEAKSGTIPYYLSSIADEIWLQPRGMLNFVGLMIESYFARPLLDMYQIIPRMDKREAYKGVHEPFTEKEFSKEVKENLQNLLNNIQEQLIQDISKDRKIDISALKNYINDGPYLDKEALQFKLIDKIGYLDDLKKHIATKLTASASYISTKSYLRTHHFQINPQKKIAVVTVDGALMTGKKNSFLENDATSPSKIIKSLKRAAADPEVGAVVLRINSPGGTVTAAEGIWHQVTSVVESGKPVIASLGTVAASAGYMIACAANQIVANPATITGSIGVATGKLVTTGVWNHFGIYWDRIKTGNNAGMWSMNEDFSEQAWKKIQSMLDYYYQDFLEKVAKGRRLELKAVQDVAQGKVWTGLQAKEKGLIDHLGDFSHAVEIAKGLINVPDKNRISVQEYNREESFFQEFQNLMDIKDKVAFLEKMAASFDQENVTFPGYQLSITVQ